MKLTEIIESLREYLINKRFENDYEIIVMIEKYLANLADNDIKDFGVKCIAEKTLFDDEYQDFEKIVILGTAEYELYDFSLYYAKGRCENIIIISVDYEEL